MNNLLEFHEMTGFVFLIFAEGNGRIDASK